MHLSRIMHIALSIGRGLAVALCLGLAACDNPNGGDTPATQDSTEWSSGSRAPQVRQPADPAELVGIWQVDTAYTTFEGQRMRVTEVQYTYMLERKGRGRLRMTMPGGAGEDDDEMKFQIIPLWSTSGNRVTIVTQSMDNHRDTMTYIRQLDEPDRQHWVDDKGRVEYHLTRR